MTHAMGSRTLHTAAGPGLRGLALRDLALHGLALPLLFACSAPARPPTAEPGARSELVARTAADAGLAIAVTSPPDVLVVDGDLGEWGTDRAAPGTIHLALSERGISIAAKLPPGAEPPLWIAVGASPSLVPPVGR